MNLILLLPIIAFTSTQIISSNLNPSSCAELLVQGNINSGVYTIHPRAWYGKCPFKVFCDMETDGGGWTKRENYEIHENFSQNWYNYKKGFGNLEQEFWLGNDHLFILTNQDQVVLRVELEDFEENTRTAEYTHFKIGDESLNYQLTVSGYHGDAGDGLAYHNRKSFVTFDKNDVKECSKNLKGAWWYDHCYHSSLNGEYLMGKNEKDGRGVSWSSWLGNSYSLKRTEMKVRPINFSPHWTFKQE